MSITNGIVSSKIYDKRDDFNFEIVNFPFLDGDVPRSPSYPIVGVCNCSMFCCTLLCVRSSIAIILMGKRELVALLNLLSWCLVMVARFFLAVPQGCLRFVIVVFPDHTHLLFFLKICCGLIKQRILHKRAHILLNLLKEQGKCGVKS